MSDAELVRICLYWIIRYIALAPLSLKRRADDEALEAVSAHLMLDLLMTPNEEYDFATMLRGTAWDYNVGGNAFWWVEESEGMMPLELWWIPRERVRVEPPKEGRDRPNPRSSRSTSIAHSTQATR